jgi:hypothetical protein
VVEKKASFSREANHHTVACCTYKAERHCAHQVPSFLTLAFKSFTLPFIACCTAPTPHVMACKVDQTLHVGGQGVVDDAKSISGAESNVQATSSSSNVVIEKMVNKDTAMLFDYWKKSIVTEANRFAYHTTDWLGDALESFVPEVDIPIVDNSSVVFFESHPVVGLGHPPSKFLFSILNFLRCELVHQNQNVIAVLSYFTMLCECWLEIAPNTSLFWYFYGPARYEKTIFFGIGQSWCCHH